MNEAETRAELINPALKAAGWGVVEASRVRREVITPVRHQGAGRPSSHIHGPANPAIWYPHGPTSNSGPTQGNDTFDSPPACTMFEFAAKYTHGAGMSAADASRHISLPRSLIPAKSRARPI